MSAKSTIVDTKEGQAHVSTKSRWLYIFPMPHTGAMPYPCSATDLKRLSVFIKWNTNEPAMLATLHGAIVRTVEEFGISGLVEIANSAKMTQQVAKTFGGSWHDIVKQAAQDGVAFPLPDDVLRYIKGFM
jgi:hypothetical protein